MSRSPQALREVSPGLFQMVLSSLEVLNRRLTAAAAGGRLRECEELRLIAVHVYGRGQRRRRLARAEGHRVYR